VYLYVACSLVGGGGGGGLGSIKTINLNKLLSVAGLGFYSIYAYFI